jgi:4-hydroxy-4-methyl-2-oxoglutarate aldolase
MTEPPESFASLDSCAISDALDRHGLASAVGGIANLTVQHRIAGPVATVRLGLPEDVTVQPGQSVRHLGTTAIVESAPGTVIVIEQRTGIEAAGWGGILTRAAVRHGIAGVICEGWVRDVDEAIEQEFPLYARGATARTARGRIAEIGTNVAVTIGDVTVRPGDWVVADSSGVAFIPAEHLESVINTALDIVARERAMATAVDSGQPVTEVMGATYEQLLARNSEVGQGNASSPR